MISVSTSTGQRPSGSQLTVEQLGVQYRTDDGADAPALDQVDLQVEPGEIVAILGPSGSGKSTLLRAVAGLVTPTAGRVLLDGRNLAATPTHKRDLGLMFQDHALFGHLTVGDNVSYGLAMAGVDRRERQRRVGELLELVGLDGFTRRRPDQLSGGEAQRVALARALAPRPRLLMLDEPLGSLDRALRESLTDELAGLLRSLGQTALHVTHDQEEAFAVADRLVVLDGGRVLADGTPAALWSDPGTAELARFFGRPNLWPLEVDAAGGVRVAGQDLGQRSADGGARPLRTGVALVPLDALQPVEADVGEASGVAGTGGSLGQLRAHITACRFGQGRYQVRALAGDVSLTFVADRPQPTGSEVVVSVDIDQFLPLD